jgi:hypothetical protein
LSEKSHWTPQRREQIERFAKEALLELSQGDRFRVESITKRS